MQSYLSLGSNEGSRVVNLRQALSFLEDNAAIQIQKTSSLYETEPWGGVEQDAFLNIAVEIETTLDAFELLKSCQEIEAKLGRKRSVHWGPRSIDIDILTYGNFKIQTDTLTIPHPYMESREFVLAPLREISPALILPSGKSIQQTIGDGIVKKITSL